MDLKIVNKQKDTAHLGVWFNLQASKFKIAFAGSSKFRLAIANSQVMGAVQHDHMCIILSHYILLDWVDVKDPLGQILPYSINMARHALSTNSHLFDFVVSISSNGQNYEKVVNRV